MNEDGEGPTTTPTESPDRRVPEGAQYRATNRAQFERQADAADQAVLVESTFNNTDGGKVVTYTGTGRAIQRQEWTFGPKGKLVQVEIKDAFIQPHYSTPDAATGKTAKKYLEPGALDHTAVQTARALILSRGDSGPENTFYVIKEEFNGNLMESWNSERAAHAGNLTSRRPEPVMTTPTKSS